VADIRTLYRRSFHRRLRANEGSSDRLPSRDAALRADCLRLPDSDAVIPRLPIVEDAGRPFPGWPYRSRARSKSGLASQGSVFIVACRLRI
jgi:hypothetical protein